MYLNKKQLKERGWSQQMISRFLGKPDDIQPIGRYCEEHLYFIPRIERIEQTEEFKSAHEKYLTRRNAGKLAAKKQAEERIKSARTMPIRIRRVPVEQLLEDAMDHFNRRRHWRDWDDDNYFEFKPADQNSAREFLERIQVNYIRHELTSYDSKLLAQRGRIGGDDAVQIIRRRVFFEISYAYPHLENECFRQMRSRNLISQIEFDNWLMPQYEQLNLPF